jgi:hypothetical protein
VSRGEGELLTVPKPRAVGLLSVCLTVKPVGEPDALIGHVRFDERGWETERCRMAQATAPILDSTLANNPTAPMFVRFWTKATRLLDRPTPPQRRLAQKKEGHVLKTKRPESEDPGIIPRPSYCELLQAYIDKYSTHVSVTTTSCAGYQ